MKDKKISIVEIAFILPAVLSLDLLELVTGDAWSSLVFIEGFVFAFLQAWLIFKGANKKSRRIMLTGNGIELIPLVGTVFWRTLALLIAVYVANRPEKFEKAKESGKFDEVVSRWFKVKHKDEGEEEGHSKEEVPHEEAA